MTASTISFTQGSGTRLATNAYTEGGLTVHDEKTIVGLQYLPTFNLAGFGMSTATANSHLFQIMAGASLNVYITRIRIYQVAMATTATLGQFDVYRLTTAGTGGTSSTAISYDTDSIAATGMSLPTAKGTEGNTLHRFALFMPQTIPTAVDFNALRWELTPDLLRMKAFRIPAGTSNGIAIKNVTAIAGAQVTIDIDGYEASF